MDSQYSGEAGHPCVCPPCPKSFAWWDLYVPCEEILKALAPPPPPRVPDGNDSVRTLSLLPDKLKALFYGQQRPLPARATSSSFPNLGGSRQRELPTGGRGHRLGKFYMITGVGSDPQQPSALPGPLSSHPCFWARLCTAAAFFFLFLNCKMWPIDGQDWGNIPGPGVVGSAMSSEGQRWPSSQ